MGHEMIRVRVLFLEPGNLIHPSELDDGITEHTVKADRMIYGEDYEDFGIWKVNSAALAESIDLGSIQPATMISTPNDPCMEMTASMTVVYFDVIAVNSDWASPGGGIGYTIENIGLWETFGQDFDTLVAHAKTLLDKPTAHKDDYGTKVQFMAMYDWASWTDYWGEWDCDHRLVGFFNLSDVRVKRFGPPRPEHPDALDVIDQKVGDPLSST